MVFSNIASIHQFADERIVYENPSKKATRFWAIEVLEDRCTLVMSQGASEDSIKEKSRKVCRKSGRGKTSRTAEENALIEYRRRIALKLEQEYVPLGSESTSLPSYDFPFDLVYPPELSPPKPHQKITEQEHRDLYDSGRAEYLVKYDGIGSVAVYHTFGWRIYTLGGNENSEKIQAALKALEQDARFPVRTMLASEALLFTGETPWSKDFGSMVGSFLPTKDTANTKRKIESGDLPEPTLVVYDVLYYGGQSLADVPRRERQKYLSHLPVGRYGNGPLCRAEAVDVTPENWKIWVEQSGAEGLVINDLDATHGRKMLTASSEPLRTAGSYKLLVNPSEDVVMYAVKYDVDGPRSVFVKQRYPMDLDSPLAGQWFPCGKITLHKKKDLKALVHQLAYKNKLHVVVNDAQGEALSVDSEFGVPTVIEYLERFPSNKFRQGTFQLPVRLRHDPKSGDFKPAKHCFAGVVSLPG